MKNLSIMLILLSGAFSLAGCVEDDLYYKDYRNSGYYSTYSNNVGNPGYNRDYHQRNNRKHRYEPAPASPSSNTTSSNSNSGYYSTSKKPAQINRPQSNGGYYSTGSST